MCYFHIAYKFPYFSRDYVMCLDAHAGLCRVVKGSFLNSFTVKIQSFIEKPSCGDL